MATTGTSRSRSGKRGAMVLLAARPEWCPTSAAAATLKINFWCPNWPLFGARSHRHSQTSFARIPRPRVLRKLAGEGGELHGRPRGPSSPEAQEVASGDLRLISYGAPVGGCGPPAAAGGPHSRNPALPGRSRCRWVNRRHAPGKGEEESYSR